MELAQIRMFKAVADTGSMVRAADQMHCVPSNVTARIRALEDELETLLFHREGRRLRISPAGEVFLTYVEKVLALLEEGKRAVDPRSEPSGPLRLGAIESAATARLPRLLAKFHAAYPGVSLQLSTGTWPQLLDEVTRHQLDGAIVAVPLDRPDLSEITIYHEELVLIASPSQGRLRGAEDLRGKTIYMWPDGCPYRAALRQWLRAHGDDPSITSIASYGTIVGCVSAGAGVSLVPKGIFLQFGQKAGLRGYEFPDLCAVENRFVWARNTGRHPARDAFVRLLIEEFAQDASVG